MKKITTTAFLIILATGFGFSQSKTVKEFHDKYRDDRDAKVVRLNGSLFKLIAQIASYDEDDEDAQAVSRIGEGIESMDIVAVPLFDSGLTPAEFDRMKNELKDEKYEELMEMRDGREKVSVLTQGNKNQVKNMVILVREDESIVVMNVNGTLDMKDVAYLAKNNKKWH